MKRNQSGSALIQALVGMGVMATMTGIFASMMNQMGIQQQLLFKKLEYADLKMTLLSSLSKGEVCTWQFLGQTLPLPGAPLSISELRSGVDVSSPLIIKKGEALPGTTAGLVVQDIVVAEAAPFSGPLTFQAKLQVLFEEKAGTPPINPPTISIRFIADAANKIISCVDATTQKDEQPSPSSSGSFNLSAASLGNCDGAPQPKGEKDGVLSKPLVPEEVKAAKKAACDSIAFPVPENGMVALNKGDFCGEAGNGMLSSSDRDSLVSKFFEHYNISKRNCTEFEKKSGLASPLLAGMSSKEDCLKLPFFPQGTVNGSNPMFGSHEISDSRLFCLSGKWIKL